MALVEPDEYQEIRALLDAQLTDSDLRKEVIETDVHLGQAEREVLARIPSAQDMVDEGGEDGLRVKRAVKLLTAASLAPVIVRLTSVSVQTRDTTYSRQTFDPTKRAAELRSMAQEELAHLEAPDSDTATYAMPTMFAVASGSRGR